MKITLSLILTVSLSSLFGQMPDFNWSKSFSGTQDQNGNSIIRDSSGNYYSAGQFSGVVDFDPGPGLYQMTSAGNNSDGYIMKQDAQGNLIWVKQLAGSAQESCRRIELDQNGDVYIVGDYTGSIDFDPGAGVESAVTAGFYDAFILKLSSDGNYIWSKHIGGVNQDSFYDLKFDQQNNLIVSGVYAGNVDVDPGPGTVMLSAGGSFNGIVLKLTSDGDFIFAKTFDSNYLSVVDKIEVNSANEIIVQGVFKDSCDLDPGIAGYIASSPGSFALFCCKLTNSGDFVWGKSVLLSLNGPIVYHPTMNIDNLDNIIIAGIYVGTSDFDPGVGVYNLTATAGNGFILKLNDDGEFDWVKNLNGTNQMIVSNIQLDDDRNIYLTGFLQGQVDFDPGSGTHYEGNAQNANPYYGYVAKYNSSGTLNWVYAALELYPAELTVNDDKIAITGFFRTSIDFDPSAGSHIINSQGGGDIFVCEWTSNCFNRISEVITSCSDYTWSKNNQVYTSSGTFSFVVENPTGCDSIFTLELTIPAITVSIDFDTILCDTSMAFSLDAAVPVGGVYEINGQVYTSINPEGMNLGSYSMTYTIVEDGCPFSDTALFSLVHCSGLAVEPIENERLSIYPNPTDGLLFCNSVVTDFDLIEVFDAQGRRIAVPLNAQTIDLSELSNGLYTIQIKHAGQIAAFKIVLDN